MKELKLPKIDLSFPFLKIKPGLPKAQKKIGLDLGSFNLKVIELESRAESWKVSALAMKDIRGSKDPAQEIKKIFSDLRISGKKVNIALSGEGVVARYLSLPKMSDEELKKAITFELEDHIPFRPEDIYLDYRVMGEEANSSNKMRVFLVAAKKELVEEKLEIVRRAGLEPDIITMDALTLKNTFNFNYAFKENVNAALLNIGDKWTNLIITRGKIPYFVRDTRFGGSAITALLQAKLSVDKLEAEKIKNNLKGAQPETIQIVKGVMANLLNEIFISMDFYENLTEQKIEEIYLSGGSFQVHGLTELLTGYLVNIGIYPLDPFKNFSFAPHISQEEVERLAPYFSVAVGLALEEP